MNFTVNKVTSSYLSLIGIFNSPNYDVNPQPYTLGIGPLVGRTSGNRRSVMHVLAVILNKTCHFFFICIFIRVTLSGREICPLLIYPSIFLIFQNLINNKNTSSGKEPTPVKTTGFRRG